MYSDLRELDLCHIRRAAIRQHGHRLKCVPHTFVADVLSVYRDNVYDTTTTTTLLGDFACSG